MIFAHSQGAIIAEHALRLMGKNERERLRVFTFGGGSFIAPGACHPDSHNYASAADFVCRMGSPNLQYLALQRYFGSKEGHDEKKVSLQLAVNDALFDLDSTDPKVVELYAKQRTQYYESEFAKISNVTILDPDPKWRHKFNSSCYQGAVQAIIKRYRHS